MTGAKLCQQLFKRFGAKRAQQREHQSGTLLYSQAPRCTRGRSLAWTFCKENRSKNAYLYKEITEER